MNNVSAVLSMLHESGARNCATRTFRDEPVLAWTLERLTRARHVAHMAILCWEDQLDAVTPIAEEHGACVLSKDPRIIVPTLESISASRRWADGWRGGLLGACDFDLGFHASWISEILEQVEADAVVLVDPSAALVDPAIIDALIEHAREHDSMQLFFTQAAPGLAGVVLLPSLLAQLRGAKMHPGKLLSYMPDQPVRDPIAGSGCMPVQSSIARRTRSFKLDSDRQIARISEAAIDLNGELLGSDAETLVHRLRWSKTLDPLPREVVLEINTNRACSPIFWPGKFHMIERPPMSLELARRIFAELSQVDDARLTIGGVGDPLLHPQFFEIVDAAKDAEISAIHVETDLLTPAVDATTSLVDPRIDVVSFHLPAMTPATYAAVMGVDAFGTVLENVRRFVTRRHEMGRGVPILVPTFVKCQQNLAEMEEWYDRWLLALGCAVITGPSDYAALIPDCGVADMSPAARKPCARLASRMTILSDGRAVTCEQDVLARQVVGNLNFDSLAIVWNNGMQPTRQMHACGRADATSICARCTTWNRP